MHSTKIINRCSTRLLYAKKITDFIWVLSRITNQGKQQNTNYLSAMHNLRSTCMLKARRQRSSWARIKLSIKIDFPITIRLSKYFAKTLSTRFSLRSKLERLLSRKTRPVVGVWCCPITSGLTAFAFSLLPYYMQRASPASRVSQAYGH